MLLFHVGGFLILYGLMRFQASLPFNPAEQSAVAPDLSFNTAISFITNTNWQNYGGEGTMSYLTQMLGLTHQNFLSAATGIVLAVALIRGFARASAKTIGNFWVDITRCTLYILIPICVSYALFLVWQGIPQTLGAYVDATTLEGAKQTIAIGPVASQVAIKMLGTNGGGFFNANAAHPFENPTALSNFLQIISIFAIGAALTNVFGRMVGNQRQGWAILAVMGVLFIAGVIVCYWAEAGGTTTLNALGLTGGNMEGKEVRFGIVASALFAVITTAASCGAVNAMHDSFTALGGMIPLINMQLGEIIVGGVGAGLYGMLLFVIISIFVAGLMVGRTPEYVGKKIEAKEVKMAMLAILVLPLMYLGWTAVAAVDPDALTQLANAGPHGFSEMLYLYTSSTANNGSAFAGITANTLFFNITGAVAMFVGRFLMIVPAIAIAGSLAGKKISSAVSRHVPDHWRPFHRPGCRRDRHRRRPHLLSRARARASSRASRDAGRHRILSGPIGVTIMDTTKLRKRMPVATLLDPKIVGPAIGQAFVKLNPATLIKNPVIFVLEIVTALTTVLLVRDLVQHHPGTGFTFQIVLWLWFTVLFANFAEAVAEGRGKAQADTLRRSRVETQAKKLSDPKKRNSFKAVSALDLRAGDFVLVEAGDVVPGDGDVVEGIASVNEAAITGESAPVIRESGGDRSAVTGGTTVISDWIVVHITSSPGSSFLDRMIALVEGAERQKTPNEIALNILLIGLTIIFVFATATIPSYATYAGGADFRRHPGGVVRDVDPDHDRSLAFGHRHCRHGPAGALQCAGDVGPSGGSRRRRRYAAARQDRHHHLRQSACDRNYCGAGRQRARGRGSRIAGQRCRRDCGRPLHHHVGAGKV